MLTVWKWTIDLLGAGKPTVQIALPRGAKVLSVGWQTPEWRDGVKGFSLWALVDPNVSESDVRTFMIVGTGQDATPPGGHLEHISTISVGGFMFHAFEVVSDWP